MEGAKIQNVPGKNRHYCTICSNYRGKTVGGRIVKLHRFPQDTRLSRAWRARLKLVRKDFKFNNTIRLCSEHFVDGQMSHTHSVPSIFANKIFDTSSVQAKECGELQSHEPMDISEELMESDNTVPDPLTVRCGLEASLMMHDYSHSVHSDQLPLEFNKEVQTDKSTFSSKPVSVQTASLKMSDAATQTDFVHVLSRTEMEKLKSKPKMKTIAIQARRPEIAIQDIHKSDESLMFYTGVPNANVFTALFDEMKDDFPEKPKGSKGRPKSLNILEEFFLILMRLRLGLLLEDLAYRFRISRSTCAAICDKWTTYLATKLDFLTVWPSRDVIDYSMPREFQEKYPNCRVIIDCTELFTESPQSLINKTLMYSHYKSHMTYKALVGISPSGLITFASDLWAGSVSDKQLTKRCGILDLCEPNDMIMADKGFLISDLTTPRGIHLVLPPFKNKRFTRREIEETRRIAHMRIHVERAMERIKNFRILQGVIPITMSKKVSKIFHICVHLSNLQPPLVKD